MIDRQRKIVILHPPKTGGQALQKALGLPIGRGSNEHYAVWRHDTLEDVRKWLPGTATWPVYLLVRNPFARMVSYYHYCVQVSLKRVAPVIKYARSFASCEAFLERAELGSLRMAANTHHNGTIEPCAYYASINGEYQESAIPIHTERLAEEARRHFGVDDVPVVNATDHRDWRIYYTPKSTARVADYMHEDCDRFGYCAEEA